MAEPSLETLYQQMGEYTQMTEELPFDDFSSYYDQVMSFLQTNYQDLDEQGLVRLKGITMIIAANASLRAGKKDANKKKFAKMGDKAKFWEEAIELRLKNQGLAAAEVEEKSQRFVE